MNPNIYDYRNTSIQAQLARVRTIQTAIERFRKLGITELPTENAAYKKFNESYEKFDRSCSKLSEDEMHKRIRAISVQLRGLMRIGQEVERQHCLIEQRLLLLRLSKIANAKAGLEEHSVNNVIGSMYNKVEPLARAPTEPTFGWTRVRHTDPNETCSDDSGSDRPRRRGGRRE